MTAENTNILENGPDLTETEVADFEDRFEEIVAEISDVDAFVSARSDEALVSVAAEDAEADDIQAAGSYRVVDLRGRFCPAWSSWGNSGKGYGVVGHYNGPPAPQRAWDNPIAWVKFLCDLHSAPGRFAPGWTVNGAAYCELVAFGTVYRIRNYGADLPHCGNLAWNRNSLGLHIPVGGSQRLADTTFRTFFARAGDHLRAMGHGSSRRWCVGHREVGSSACPGGHIQNQIHAFRNGRW